MSEFKEELPTANAEKACPLTSEQVRKIASQFHSDGILSPNRYDGAQEARERLVAAFAHLTRETGEYLTGECDTLIIDQKSGNLPGLFFKHIIEDINKKTGKITPFTHDVVASIRLRNRERLLEEYFRDKFRAGEIGDHILIVTEHAISRNDRSLVTFAHIIRRIAVEFGREPEIRIAAVSIAKEFPTLSQQADRGLVNNYQWYAGELGYSIGSSAFHREYLNDLAYSENSPRPRQLPASEAGPNIEAAKSDMRMLARELAPLVVR